MKLKAALFSSRKAVVGLAVVVAFALLAALGPLLVGDPTDFVGTPLEPPSRAHWLGTTGQGQDVLWQTVAGARPTLLLGFGVGFLVVAIGTLVGSVAGYLGGRVDALLNLVINVFLVMPALPLMVVLAAYLSPGLGTMGLVLTIAGWAWSARVARASAMSLRSRDFVAAAVVTGEGALRIVVREILPVMGPLVASMFVGASLYAIAAQVGLEFLGLGDSRRVTWGSALYFARNDAALITGSWWTFVPAGVCIGVLGGALALLASAFDEIGDPRLRVEGSYRRRAHGGALGDAPTVVLRS